MGVSICSEQMDTPIAWSRSRYRETVRLSVYREIAKTRFSQKLSMQFRAMVSINYL